MSNLLRDHAEHLYAQELEELRRAAQSLRQLTELLERHPESILFGKPD